MTIRELRQEGHDLLFMLKYIKMPRSTYYYNVARFEPEDKYRFERKRISEIFTQHHKRYGYRRVCIQLRNEGYVINHKTVQKLMQEMHLKSVVRKIKYRSYKGEVGRIAANVLERDFTTQAPNRKWATDVTEFKIGDRKAYLSPILDMYNGEIISYTISDSPDLRMVINMINSAIRKVKPQEGLILHSDQGWHYQHMQYQLALKRNGIIQSMSRKGNCLDNAMMENFFGIMKSELLYLQEFKDMDHFKQELKKYIHYYNNDRIKLRLKGKSPVQYRTLYQ